MCYDNKTLNKYVICKTNIFRNVLKTVSKCNPGFQFMLLNISCFYFKLKPLNEIPSYTIFIVKRTSHTAYNLEFIVFPHDSTHSIKQHTLYYEINLFI